MQNRTFDHKKITLVVAALVLASMAALFGGCGSNSDSAQPAAKASWSFAVTCDTRSSYASDPTGTASPYYSENGVSPYFKNVAKALSREKGIDLVLFPGDLIRGKKPYLTQAEMRADLTEWKTAMQPVVDAGMPVYYVRGNHDQYAVSDPTGTDTGYDDAMAIWNELISLPGNTVNPITMATGTTYNTYSFTHKGSLFLGVDEYSEGTQTFVETFVHDQLAQSASHKFVMAHQPIWNYKADELGPAGLADVLEAGNADLFFSGHIHSYQRIAENGYRFQEMIVGTGGAPQDDYPTVDSSGTGYVADPNLTVKSYTGGPDANARLGYVIVTVHSDGSLTSVLKILDNPDSADSTVSTFDAANVTPK